MSTSFPEGARGGSLTKLPTLVQACCYAKYRKTACSELFLTSLGLLHTRLVHFISQQSQRLGLIYIPSRSGRGASSSGLSSFDSIEILLLQLAYFQILCQFPDIQVRSDPVKLRKAKFHLCTTRKIYTPSCLATPESSAGTKATYNFLTFVMV